MEEIETFLNLFASSNVNMVIAGHNHQQLVEVLGNTTYLTPDAIKDGENNASYLIMNIECNKTDYRFVYL